MIRALLDTSAFIAALLSPSGAAGVILIEFWRNQHAFELLICPDILTEYLEVATRPHIARLANSLELTALLEAIAQDAVPVLIEPPYAPICIDPDDDVFFACARIGAAQYLVSHDREHILPVATYGEVAIVSPAAFLSVLRADEGVV